MTSIETRLKPSPELGPGAGGPRGALARLPVMALGLAFALAGCRAAADGPTLRVFAASSLTEGFQDLADRFEARRPSVDVELAFAGSQVLRVQIEQGARADVFASANPEHMDALLAAGRVQAPVPLAENALVLIVPLANPAEIESFDDLPQARRIVIGTDRVPVGRYARAALEGARARWGDEAADRVRQAVVSEESNVRLVRAKIELGEADAALVYRTDAAASERVRSVPLPDDLQVEARYVIARVSGTERPNLTDAWIELARGPVGRRILEARGFTVR